MPVYKERYQKPSRATVVNPIEYEVTESGCWEVTSLHRRDTGYTRIVRNGKSYGTHRYVYIQEFGDIPDELLIRHKCDNRLCINPEHLETGTNADNMRDMVERGGSKPMRISKEQYFEIIESIKAGHNMKQMRKSIGSSAVIKAIANNTHTSCKDFDPERTEVYKIAKDSGVKPISKEKYQEVKKLLETDLSMRKISALTGVGAGRVKKIKEGRHHWDKVLRGELRKFGGETI